MLEQLQAQGEALSLRHVAYHEAGHCLGCLELGYPLDSVSIIEDEQTRGRVLTPPGWKSRIRYTDPREREVVATAICVLLCGPAATAYRDGHEPEGRS